MILNQIKIEFRRHTPFFLTLVVIQLACGIFFAFQGNSDLAFTALLVGMVIGILIPIYIFIDYYREFYVGSTVLNHMVPISTFRLFLSKSFVFFVGCLVVWISSLLDLFMNPEGFYQMRMQISESTIWGLSYLFASKLAGTLSGLAIIGLAIAAGKQLHRRIPSVILMTLVPLLIIGMLATLIVGETPHWSLGTSSLQAFKQYAGFLSITNVYEGTITNVNDTIRWDSVAFNTIACIVSAVGCFLLFHSKKYEIYGK